MQLLADSADECAEDSCAAHRLPCTLTPSAATEGIHMTAAPTVDTPRKFTTDDELELPAELVADLVGRLRAYLDAPVLSP